MSTKILNIDFDINITQDIINEYINNLNEQELIVLNIAKTQLETSFDISKSIGFIEWIKNKPI
jgi:hypothetical protein